MKIKNKGKVYPSPSSSSSSSDGDSLSVLKVLPAAILALASVLSLEDREVLAYLITRSIKTTATSTAAATNSTSSSIIQRKASKKAAANGSGNSGNNNNTHKPPVFDCDCFDCYTSYWFRWDSSPNRELIHQAIEAFEDHLTNGESEKSKKNGKAKRRDKTARRFADKSQVVAVEDTEESSGAAAIVVVVDVAETLPENEVAVAPVSSPEKVTCSVEENEVVVVDVSGESTAEVEEEEERPAVLLSPTSAAAAAAASSCSHKGLARKVLPDVLGLFNSRLWSLWSPNA